MKALIELVLIAFVVVLAFIGKHLLEANKPVPPDKHVVEHVPYVEVTTAQRRSHTLAVDAEGRIVTPARLTLGPEISGRVVEVAPELADGARVQAGTLLVRIDDADAQVALASARANLAAREAAVTVEKTRAEVAIADWREFNEGTPPATVSRAPELELARAQVEQARAQLAQAELTLARTRITMPFTGRVITESVEVGQHVSPSTQLATFERSGQLEARLELELADLDLLGLDPRGAGAADLDVELSARIGKGTRTWRARGVRTLTDLSPTNPVVTLVCEVILAADQIAPPSGLFVEATVQGRTVEAFALPSHAVDLNGRALLLEDDLTLHAFDAHPIQTRAGTTFAAVGFDLQDGQRVVTAAPPVVVEGMRVRLAD